jgi:hypothetical protein
MGPGLDTSHCGIFYITQWPQGGPSRASKKPPASNPGARTRSLRVGGGRIKAIECRRLTYEGLDPMDARRDERAKIAHESSKAPTFEACAEQYIACPYRKLRPDWLEGEDRGNLIRDGSWAAAP